jgi:L-asparaginase
MDIKLILCGGTIDKTYIPNTEKLEFRKTHFNDLIKKARLHLVNININELFLKDSWDMTEKDRNLIYESVKNSKEDKIIISHGTSTMTESAKLFFDKPISGKKIIFFGAMIPYEFLQSDGVFNFGMAVATTQTVKEGVYISMGGKVWDAKNVKKNHNKAVFE